MLSGHSSYRSYLKSVLADRITENPSYSLRAFAKNLDMAPSTLAEVLKGTTGVSQARALKIADHLKLSEKERMYFCLLVQYEAAKSQELKESLLERLNELNPKQKTRDLSVDIFRTIASWYHVAILEMTYLQGEQSPESIAKKLGISSIEAQAAIDRLERLELLARSPDGKIFKTDASFTFKSPVANSALRKFHGDMLQKAIESLETQTPQEKFIGSERFPLDSSKLSRAAELAEEFFAQLLKLSRESRSKDHVYHAGVQIFRLTKSSRSQKRNYNE